MSVSAGVWKEHFEQLFNCINDVRDVTFSTEYSSDIAVSAAEVEQAVMRLRHKKACGLDGILRSILRTVVGVCSRLWPCACLASLSMGFYLTRCYLLYLCLSSSSSLGSRCVPWLGEGLSMLSPNYPILCFPLPYRVAPVFVQVVSPSLGWSPLSSFLVIWSPTGDTRGPTVVFEAVDMPCPGPFHFS